MGVESNNSVQASNILLYTMSMNKNHSMNKEPTLLSQSFGILNSFFLLVFVAYMTEVFIDSDFARWFGIGAFMIYIPLKIFIMSGACGGLVSIISGEDFFLCMKQIKSNAKKYWKPYFLLLFLTLLIKSVLMMSNPPSGLLIGTIVAKHLNIVILAVFAWVIISSKYLKPLSLPVKKLTVHSPELLSLAGLYAAELLLFYQPYFLGSGSVNVVNIVGLLTIYVQFAQFIYIAGLIMKLYPEIDQSLQRDRELYLISPPLSGAEAPFDDFVKRWLHSINPPMFVVLSALTPKNYKIKKFNKVIWQDRYYRKNKLVAIACFSTNCAEAYKIAKEFKRRGSTVVMGGPHVTYLTDEALDFCDSVVIGEAEGIWPQVIKDYENNQLKKTYSGGRIEECHHLVYQELLNSEPEVIRDFLETSRGCKFSCHFCTVPGISGGNIRNNPVEEFVTLIKKIKHKYKRLTFIDNNIYNDPAYSKELFKAIKPLGIKWHCCSSLDIAANAEILKLAKEAGCDTMLCGFEIADKGSVVKNRNGKLTMIDNYLEYARNIEKAGIKLKATFVIGWADHNLKKLRELYKFCFRMRPFLTAFYLLTPWPGTPVFNEMLANKKIYNLNWKRYTQYNLVLKLNDLNYQILNRLYAMICFISYISLSRALSFFYIILALQALVFIILLSLGYLKFL